MITASDTDDSAPWIDARPGGVGVVHSWREPDGSPRIASAGTDRMVRVWDPEAGAPVGDPLVGHSAVVAVMTSWTNPDGGTRLASSGEDGTIRFWNPSTGVCEVGPLPAHSSWVTGLTRWRAADGGWRVASASIDRTVRIWDGETGAPIGEPLTDSPGGLWAVASLSSPDGAVWLAAGGDDGTLRIWDAESHKLIRTMLAHPSGLFGLIAWTDNQGTPRLASGGFDGSIRLWDAASGDPLGELAPAHSGAVRSLTRWQTANGEVRLASAATDGTVRIWDMATHSPVGDPLTGHFGWMPTIANWTGRDDVVRLASVGPNGTIRIWDPATDVDVVPPISGHTAGMWALTSWIDQDGQAWLASGGDNASIQVWNPETGTTRGAPMTGHTAGIWTLTSWVNADGSARVASAGDDGTIRVWDPDAGAEVCEPLLRNMPWIPALVNWLAADGTRQLASGCADGVIRIWNLDTGELPRTMADGHRGWVTTLTVCPDVDGVRRLVSGSNDGTIRIWDVEKGTPIGAPLTGHSGFVRSTASWMSPNGDIGVASAGYDGSIRLWDLATGSAVGGASVGHLSEVAALTSWIADDGRPRFASGGNDNTVRIWDPATLREVWPPLSGHTSGVWAVTSWSTRDTGPRVASAGYDGTIRLWDPTSGSAIRTIEVGPVAIWGLSDAPASEDMLGRRELAEALADQLYRPNTDVDSDEGPTVVSIEGPWGCGKSSLMRMVRDRLGQYPRPGNVATRARPLTVRRAIRQIRRHAGSKERSTARAVPGRRGVVTAWFNPWAHQSGDQLWAGLVNEIIGAVAEALYPTDNLRERYWFTQNLGRVDHYALRRTLLRRMVSPLLGLGLVAAAAPLVVTAAAQNRPLQILGKNWTTAGIALTIAIAVIAAGLIHTVVRYCFGRAARYLPGEFLHLPVIEEIALSGSHGQAETLFDPLRRARAGTLYLLQHDVRRLLMDLGAAGYDLVVFVDDLDRCRAGTVAEIFEAMNLFLSSVSSGGGLRARFVVGLDPAVVASHLDSYSSLHSPAVALYGDDPSPGWAFLRKLIQLPVLVPQVTDAGVRRFVARMTSSSPTQPEVPRPRPAEPAAAATPAAVPRPRESGHKTPGASARSQRPAPGATQTRVIAWRTLEQHPEIDRLIVARLAAQPERSLREAKRLLNVWQLYERVLAVTDPLRQPSEAIARACQLVLIAEIVTRWPALQRALHRNIDGRRGLQLLADTVDDDDRWTEVLKQLHIGQAEHTPAVANLRRLLLDHDAKALAEFASRLL